MRKSSISMSLAMASVFLSPVVLASKPLPVQVVESANMPGKVSAYTGIFNEVTAMKASYDALQQAHNAIREEFGRTVSACQDEKCKITQLQSAAENLVPIAAGMKELSVKAASLVDGALSQLPAQVSAEREQLKKYAQDDIIAGFRKMAQQVKDAVGEENLQVDVSILPLESQRTLDTLEAKLDDDLDQLSQIVLRLDGMERFAANLANSKEELKEHAGQFWRNALAVENEVSSMNRSARTLTELAVYNNAVLTLPDIQPLEAIPRLAMPEPVAPSTTTLVTPKARNLDFGTKVEAFKVLAEQINEQ
jgi:hypothetical protein